MTKPTWMRVNINWQVCDPAPFRFLDLPAELRLMVYEQLPVTTRHHKFTYRAIEPEEYYEWGPQDKDIDVSLVVKSIPLALLATCKQINSEATRHLKPLLQHLRSEPMRLIVSSEGFGSLMRPNGFFYPPMQHCLTPLQLGNVGSLLSKRKMRSLLPLEMRHALQRLRPRSEAQEICAELAGFVQVCASFMHHRTPACSIIAIERRPDSEFNEVVWPLEKLTQDMRLNRRFDPSLRYPDYLHGSLGLLQGPVGFMLQGLATDDLLDPPSAEFPEG